MINNDLQILKEQHINNYRNTITQMILNNNSSLFDEDLYSIFRKPPLDSMDIINVKFLSLAKKYKIVLNSEEINNILDEFRESIFSLCNKNKKSRLDFYNSIVESFNFNNDDVVKILKKDNNKYNKEFKKKFKEDLLKIVNKIILSNIDKVFFDDINANVKELFVYDITKYLNNNYVKQVFESIDIKFLVKDTILINNVKEEGEKYIYTVNNSHLFD